MTTLDVFRDGELILDLLHVRGPNELDPEATLLCRRGRHPLTPENLGAGGRCRPCKLEYAWHRRRGLPWDGPIVRGVRAASQRVLPPDRLRELRAAVGACVDCGWTPDAGPHRCARS